MGLVGVDFDQILALVPEPAAVTVEAYAGSGAYGDTYTAPAAVQGVVIAKRRLVRAPDGSQVVASTTVLVPLDTAAPPRSRVTLPDGSTTLVITAARHDGHGLPVPEHTELACE